MILPREHFSWLLLIMPRYIVKWVFGYIPLTLKPACLECEWTRISANRWDISLTHDTIDSGIIDLTISEILNHNQTREQDQCKVWRNAEATKIKMVHICKQSQKYFLQRFHSNIGTKPQPISLEYLPPNWSADGSIIYWLFDTSGNGAWENGFACNHLPHAC